MDKYLIETLQQHFLSLFVAICKVNSRRTQKGQNNQKHSPNAGLRSNNQALGTKRSTKIHYDQDYTWCELVTRTIGPLNSYTNEDGIGLYSLKGITPKPTVRPI